MPRRASLKSPCTRCQACLPGRHTIQVLSTGTKSASSSGQWVWIDAFDVASGNTSSATTSTGTTTTTGGTNTTSAGGTTSGTTPTPPTGTTGGTDHDRFHRHAATGSTPPAPTPAPTPTLYRIQENNTAIRYTGTWDLHTGSLHSGNSAKLANKPGATCLIHFCRHLHHLDWFSRPSVRDRPRLR